MKFHVEGIRCGDCVLAIIEAVLRVDIGARVNVDALQEVGIAGRMTLDEARSAIEARGFRVATIVDRTIEDAIWKGVRPVTQFI